MFLINNVGRWDGKGKPMKYAIHLFIQVIITNISISETTMNLLLSKHENWWFEFKKFKVLLWATPFILLFLPRKAIKFLISIIFVYLIVSRLTQDLRTFSVNYHYLESSFETGSIQLLFLFFVFVSPQQPLSQVHTDRRC